MGRLTIDQFGVCSWSLRAEGAVDLAEKVEAVGVSKIQLGLTPHRDDPGAWDDVGEVMKSNGLEIVSGMFGTLGEDYSSPETIRRTGGVVLDENWEENQKIAADAAALAKRLELVNVSIHAGFLPHETTDPSFEKLIGRIVRIAEICSEQGLTVLFETGQETAATLRLFMDELKKRGATNVGVNFDPANMILYDMDDPVESLKQLVPHVAQVHVKDAVRTKVPGQWGEEVVVGTGQVDWRSFIQVLADADFSGGMVFEREAGDDRVGDIKKGVEFLCGVIKEVCD